MSSANMKPFWSIASLVTLLCKLVVVGLSFLVIYLTNNGFIIFFDYFFAFWVSALGAVFAVVSLFRRERHLPLGLCT
jgi:uncharacterized membrane protein